ncbi:hypothetical protein I5693_33280 [Burkholderia cenocepacia]|uniref:hypothetical protein n=1 Tax=Burkholderia cepacia complex TaxID=87882 RepID=UPI00158C4B2C|nr:hypothetical protein [Burkholderia cenocepacia]MBJ9672438.1 hypothetical protein [Burkholderia cenocepacia]MBJ9733925.1 hypothetical protein [Burkholderia cenocepacia]MBR8311300.1 hypothetical protein [Burkholderia cenocepacia]MCA7968130.1 hypothetical protein [Burkholderia cenocepacia]MDR8045756.1 hypothetical protein [Burkholderia cenocepacia]
MNVTAWQFREKGWGRGVAAGGALIALACVDRGLSALWPASYRLGHPLAANLPLLAVYLILRS